MGKDFVYGELIAEGVSMDYIVCILAILIGNFVHQSALSAPDYSIALERAYYQLGAVLVLWTTRKLTSK